MFDTAFEPLFWFVDHFTGYLGIIFVIVVTLLTSSVVMLWYLFLRPVILTYSNFYVVFHFIYGHYLLINIVFHYFQACFTSPGQPPEGKPIESIQGSVVCKYCIQPKPPRSHHCSICNKCFLNMDHHCPWMNNCIGFYNLRYFISFCVFMWLGTVYVCLTSFDLFMYHFQHPGTLADYKSGAVLSNSGSIFHTIMDTLNINRTVLLGRIEQSVDDYRPHPGGSKVVHEWEHIGIIYLFLLCGAVTVALGLLNIWHFVLTCKGETSIEVHVNASERKKAAKHGMGYNNPYNYGWKENIRKLFGLYKGRTIFLVLFPSIHTPEGNGLCWPSNYKPLHYVDPTKYEKYEDLRYEILQKFCPC